MARLDLDMTEGNIWMHMLRFSIPMAIGLLFQQLYNTVDTLVVGQFVGQQAQAAVGSTGPIINTIVGFCAGLATGASVVISAPVKDRKTERTGCPSTHSAQAWPNSWSAAASRNGASSEAFIKKRIEIQRISDG